LRLGILKIVEDLSRTNIVLIDNSHRLSAYILRYYDEIVAIYYKVIMNILFKRKNFHDVRHNFIESIRRKEQHAPLLWRVAISSHCYSCIEQKKNLVSCKCKTNNKHEYLMVRNHFADAVLPTGFFADKNLI